MKLTDKEIEKMLQSMELEEPSMSFTRNVMEQVKLEACPVSLKTKLDKRVIYVIAAIFVVLMVLPLIYALANSNLSFSAELPKFNINFSGLADKLITWNFLKAFLFIDIIIALIYIDRVLRFRKNAS